MFQVLHDVERLAMFKRGEYQGLKGPGLVLCLPFFGAGDLLRVGDMGTRMTSRLARFGEVTIPVAGNELSGSRVRIVGFDDSQSPSCPRVGPVAS
jgi:hypothetical protein